MADMGAVISAMDEYGDLRFAEGAASRQVEVDGLTQHVATLQSQVAAIQADLDAYKAAHPDAPAPTPTPTPTPTPIPTPTVARTQYGACPNGGSALSTVVTKYGRSVSIRGFVPGGFGLPVQRPADASLVHWSWKPSTGSTITDAQILTAFANLKDGDFVEVWHESDVKYRNGSGVLADMLAMKNQFYAKVVALRDAGKIPKVLVVNTWGGWSVDSTSNVDPSNLHGKADLLGIDMDGVAAKDTFYPFATRCMGTKFVNAYKAGGYKGWTIPEFTMASVASDPDQSKRVAWFKSEMAKISQGVPASNVPPPRAVMWYDTGGPLNPYERNGLTTANAIGAWSALVATNG